MNNVLLDTALHLFSSDDGCASRLYGGTSSGVYEFMRMGEPAVLRLIPPGESNDPESMASVLDWMHYLSDKGFSIPAPLVSIHDRLMETLTDGGKQWLVTAVQKARGVRAETLPFDEWTDQRLMNMGRLAGWLHRLSQGYRPTGGISRRPQWDQADNNWSPLTKLPNTDKEILQKRNEVLRHIETLPRLPGTFGLIHSDFHCANFFIDTIDDTLILFDFDDCCYGWYMMDIALPLLDMLIVYPGRDVQTFAIRFLDHFIKGYRSECSLEETDLKTLPHFLKLLEIGLYLQVADFADQEKPYSWVGKFMQGRRENILSGCPFVPLPLAYL